MVPAVTPDAVEALWQRFQPLVQQRLQTVQDHLDGSGSREDARAAAHALAGALGSYGRAEGSRLARELEGLLAVEGDRPRRERALLQHLRDSLRPG